MEPDLGWCGGIFAFEVTEGASEGIDLSGCKVALGFDWPGNFWVGNGTARLFIDQAAESDQRRELEGILGGQKGGPLAAVLPAVVTKVLPTRFTDVALDWGDPTSIQIDGFGEADLRPLTDQSGRPTTVTNAVALTAFEMESMAVASSKGGRWNDPDLRAWDSDSGTLHAFDWAG